MGETPVSYSGPVPSRISTLDAIRAEIEGRRSVCEYRRNAKEADMEWQAGREAAFACTLAIIDRHMKENAP